MLIQERVREILNALCEGTGVTETDNEDFEVLLDEFPIWVRTYETPPAITLYREIAQDVPRSWELSEKVHVENARYIVFRIIWEDDSVFLRADIPAEPICAGQLQHVLETFEAEAEALALDFPDWRR